VLARYRSRGAPAVSAPRAAQRFPRPRIDRFDVLLLAVLGALSLWTVAINVWRAAEHGLIWTGSESVFPADALQSMMWIQGVLHHGASPDLYVLADTSADFFQPLIGISAAVAALGVAPYVVLLAWKPVALAGIFFATRAYVHGALRGRGPRRVALTLALFFGWGAVIGDSWIPWWTWGYPFALLALTCAVGALLAYAGSRERERIGLLAPALGAMASWLHPWQGEILILTLLGCELAMFARGERVRAAPLLATVAASALPLGYFAALVHFDSVWREERRAAISTYPLSHVAAGFAVLALPALLAYRRAPRDFIALTVRVWPLAALGVFLISEWQGSGPTHALLGLTIPLAVLSVQGVCSLPWQAALRRIPALPLLSLPLVAALTIPGTIYMLEYAAERSVPRAGNPHFVTGAENRALAYLAHDARPGGVLAPFHLGMLVPAATARATYLGNCYWSQPGCRHRSTMTNALFAGRLSRAASRRFVQSSGARFVLADCRSRDLRAALAPVTAEVRRFSCATVYLVR